LTSILTPSLNPNPHAENVNAFIPRLFYSLLILMTLNPFISENKNKYEIKKRLVGQISQDKVLP